MSTKARAATAIKAMKDIGIPEKRVRPVLKSLLKLYDKNWELIEDENYRVLADAIFEYQETEAEEAKRNEESQLHDESVGPPLKRLRSRQHEDQASPLGETSFRRPKLEATDLPQHFPREERDEPFHLCHRDSRDEHEPISLQMHVMEKQKESVSTQAFSSQESSERSQLHLRGKGTEPEPVSPQACFSNKGKEPVLSSQPCQMQERVEQPLLRFKDNRAESDSVSPQVHLRFKGKEPISPHIASREKEAVAKRSSGVCFKEPKVEPGIILLPREKSLSHHRNDALVKPKGEPFTGDFPQFEVPIAMIHPPDPGPMNNGAVPDPVHKEGCSAGNDSAGKTGSQEALASQYVDSENENDGILDKACKTSSSLELANIPETSANFEIASSPLGEVKISLSFNDALERQDFHMPTLDAVLKMVEDKCLRSYKLIEPSFSLTRLMKELCQCVLEMGTDSNYDKQESIMHITPNLNVLEKSYLQNALGAKGDHQDNYHMPASSLNESPNFHSSTEVVEPEIPGLLALNGLDDPEIHANTNDERDKEQKDPDSSSSFSLVVVPQQNFTLDDVKPLHDINDISKGEERVKISLVNEVTSEPYPPAFYYIPRNIVYLNAYVNFSLARIGDEDCCSNCFGDCLSSSIPCACARETGGEFAYTPEGLIKEKFIDECISMYRDPEQHIRFYCKDCPIEKSKDENSPDPCKGHLVRKFIKECWSKCGCSKQCGNRVVQRGITCNLQVFFTSEGKGWGLRTLEDLPRGTFVCEYVGEILTNDELDERNIQSTGNEKHNYPVLLDADWGSERVLKDEEALCLDATIYGNVARFINHRCFDPNLVEIPVEVETPDHHYYHLAFFTTRKVHAWEELTWDYGLDFDDHSHPVKAFQCCCGSKCCRDKKRSYRTKSRA